jgi:O-antigen ligase
LLGCLVVVVHGVLARRWSTGEDALADLAVAYRVLALAAVASFVAVLAGLPGAVNPFTGRSHGIYNNPNMMGMLGVMGFLIGLALLYRKVSWLRLASVAALGGSVLMSQSRTALLAVAVALVWLLLARTRAKHTVVLIYFGSLAALTWAFMRELVRAPLPTPDLSVFGRFDATTEGGALNGRDAIWVVVLDLWRDSPILGTGYGTAPIVTPQVLTEFAVGRELTSAHNGYLQWLLETGALGAVLLSIALISALRSALMVGRSSWASALGGAVLAGLLIQAGESALLGTGQPFPYLFWLVAAACAAALDGHSAVDSGHQPDRDGRKLSSVNPARPVPSRLR